jgi:hypothetical protein
MHVVVDCKILYFYTKCSAVLTKTKVLKAIKQLPENFSIDEMVDKMILIEKIEIGLAQSKGGEVVSDESLDKEISRWFD